MKHLSDILIVGGGPAGLAAGIQARRRGMQATVVESRPDPVDKACGEGLMPAARHTLADLGVRQLDGAMFRGISYRDARDPHLWAAGDFGGACGLGVRRIELHRALSERADQLGVRRLRRRADHLEVGRDGVRAGDVTARWLIGADGLHSGIRRHLGVDAAPTGPRRYGIRRHYRCAPWSDRVQVYWSRRAEAYVTPVGARTVGVAILFRDNGRFDDLLAEFPVLKRQLDGHQTCSRDRGAGSFLQAASRRVVGPALLVGDAAGYVDALTGEGVSMALKTARAAVDAIADDQPERYETEWRRITRAYRWLTRALVALTGRRAVHRPMIGLLDRYPRLFDACLSLIGRG